MPTKIEERDFTTYLNDDTAHTLAREIIEILGADANKDTLTCSFDVSGGKMVKSNVNTWFNFDTPLGTTIDAFKKAIFSRNATDEENADRDAFLVRVANIITEKYHSIMNKTIRRVLMPSNGPRKLPMNDISVHELEISDISSHPYFARYTLKIIKEAEQDSGDLMDTVQIDTKAVVSRLSELIEESARDQSTPFGQSVVYKSSHDVFVEHKDEEVFAGVSDVIQGDRFLYDASLALFVDYSLSDEFIKAAQAGDVEKLRDMERV